MIVEPWNSILWFDRQTVGIAFSLGVKVLVGQPMHAITGLLNCLQYVNMPTNMAAGGNSTNLLSFSMVKN